MITKDKKLFHFRPLFFGFLALMLAICTSRYIFNGKISYIVFICIMWLAFLIYCIAKRRIVPLCVLLAFFTFGLGWYFVGISTFEGKEINQVCQIEGRVGDWEIDNGTFRQVILKDVSIDGETCGNIYLVLEDADKASVKTGDIIKFESYVEKVKLFELENFNTFFYRQKVTYESCVSVLDIIHIGNHVTPDEGFRLKMKSVLYQNMGEENGATAFAVLFGDKNDVKHDVKDAYKSSGTIHLLTVSGLHVGFLIALLGYVFKKCRIKGIWNFLLCCVVLFLYAWLCGFAPSVLRAGIMGLVLLTAKISGRCYDNLNALGLAGILIILIFPFSALDVGFQMSFFCVLGIFIVYPWLSKLLRKVFPKVVANSMAISLSASLGVFPFTAKIFSVFNLLSFFINLIVIPIFSVLYPLLFVGTLLSAGLPFFGFLLKLCAFGFDEILKLISFFGNTNFVFALEPSNIFVVGLLFLFLFLLGRNFMCNKKFKAVTCSIVGFALAICFGLSFVSFPVSSSINMCYNYTEQVILLTNSYGESVMIGSGDYEFNRKLLNAKNLNSVKNMFLFETEDVLVGGLQKLGMENLIRPESFDGFDEDIVVGYNKYANVGHFSFVFKKFNEEFLGLEISFDETMIFVFGNEKELSAKALQTVSNTKYDFVFVDKYIEFAQLFGKETKILSYYKNINVDASYARDGNISYVLNGKDYRRRCLD